MMPHKVFVIAEAGVNHNGSLDLARRLIDVAASAGADAVKFQTFKADRLATGSAVKADYQKATTDAGESQRELLRRLELDEAAHRVLIDHAGQANIVFMSTPFDFESVDLLARQFALPLMKIGSGEITNGPLLLAVARTGCKTILSTGMSDLEDVRQALGVIAFGLLGRDNPSVANFAAAYADGRALLTERVTLLHCTTEYPAPFDSVNLRAMDTLHSAFGLPVGLSDHSPGYAVALAAAARGATVIEKHVTLDRTLSGPDHRASLEPQDLTAMIEGIRQIESALGDGDKVPAPAERKNMPIARKSLVAARRLRKGELLDAASLAVKRPGTGLSPMRYWSMIGQPARRDYETDELLD